MFKNKMDIDSHGPIQMPNNCQLLDPSYFSLLTTNKKLRDRSKQWYKILKLKVIRKLNLCTHNNRQYYIMVLFDIWKNLWQNIEISLIHIYLESCKMSFRSWVNLSKLYLKNVHYRLTFFRPNWTVRTGRIQHKTWYHIYLRITVSESYRQNLNKQ